MNLTHPRAFVAILVVLVLSGIVFPPTLGAQEKASFDPAKLAELRTQLDVLFDDARFSDAHWGVRVETLDGEIIYDRQGGKNFVPASNMKLVTTAAALEILGPEYTYETTVDAIGAISSDGVLTGDIVITGSGDPSLGAWHPGEETDSSHLLPKWVEAIKAAGITRVSGNIVGDGRCFTEEYLNPEWVYWDLPYWYAAGTSGLAMEENAFRIDIMPGDAAGAPARYTIKPATSYVTYINEATTEPAGGTSNADTIWRQTEGNIFKLGRSIALDRTVIHERASVWDGARYSAFLLMEALERAGISVDGEAVNIRALEDSSTLDNAAGESRRRLVTHVSPPLADMVSVINQVSHNFFADQVLRTIGMEKKGEGSYEAGSSAVSDWLRSIGLPQVDSLRLVDGSGLAQINMIQPRQFTYILSHERRGDSPAGGAFYESLSVAGKSGWMSGRLQDEDLRGRIRAKTGYIEYRRTLSGYVVNVSGDEWVFSFLCNHHSVRSRDVDAAADEACRLLARTDLRQSTTPTE